MAIFVAVTHLRMIVPGSWLQPPALAVYSRDLQKHTRDNKLFYLGTTVYSVAVFHFQVIVQSRLL